MDAAPTLYVDPRAGSKDLGSSLSRTHGAPVTFRRMQYGDVVWSGVTGAWKTYGDDVRESSVDVTVGVEYKRMSDFFDSLESGRLVTQLAGMVQEAGYDRNYLLVEGDARCGSYGELLYGCRSSIGWGRRKSNRALGVMKYEAGRGPLHTYMEFWGACQSLEEALGVRVVVTRDAHESALWVWHAAKWWNKKEHRMLAAFHSPAVVSSRATWVKPTLTARIASQIRGVGSERATDAGRKWDTPAQLVLAGYTAEEVEVLMAKRHGAAIKAWEEVVGKGKTAGDVVRQLRGGGYGR